MKKTVKAIIFIFALLCAIFIFSLSACAEEVEEYKIFLDGIPERIKDKLPEKMFSDSSEDIAEGVREMSGVKYLLSEISGSLLSGISDAIPYICGILGLLIISSVIKVVSNSLSGDGAIMGVISKLCLYGAVISGCMGCIEGIKEYFDNLFAVALSFIPLSASLYSMGGNISAAVVSSSSFGVILTVCELIFTYTAIPVFCFCACMMLCSLFDDSKAILAIGGIVKKNYIFLLSLIMAILSVSISSQTLISAKADNFTMRGAKFVISSFIPHFGGSVAQSLGNVASSIELLRSAVGVGGIIIILLMLIPTVVEISVIRMLYSICASVASMLGCDGESGLLSEISSLYGYLLCVAAICSSVFIISFGILARCASAVG